MQEYTQEKLGTWTIGELVCFYNNLNPNKPLKSWKGKKLDLINRILSARETVLEEERKTTPVEEYEVTTSEDSEPESCDESAELDANEAATEAEPVAHKSLRTIQSAALELLSRVAYYEDKTKTSDPLNRVSKSHKNARSVGLPYSEVLELVHEEFPGCGTSYACLRWYAVHARAGDRGHEDVTLPQCRPRSKPTKR